VRDREADFSLETPAERYAAICAIAKRLGARPPTVEQSLSWTKLPTNHANFLGAIEMCIVARDYRTAQRKSRGPRRPVRKSRVYLLAGGSHIKIGTTHSVAKRLRALQCGSPIPLRVLVHFPGDAVTESALHQRFAALRAHGEWFRAEQPLLDFVAEMKRRQSR